MAVDRNADALNVALVVGAVASGYLAYRYGATVPFVVGAAVGGGYLARSAYAAFAFSTDPDPLFGTGPLGTLGGS